MALEQEIHTALLKLAPKSLQVVNESALHSGHAGDDGSGESHWRVVIESPQLMKLSRIARHRAVHSALGQHIIGRIHALSIDVS